MGEPTTGDEEMEANVIGIFQSFQDGLLDEQEKVEAIKEVVKELEKSTRMMTITLQTVHKPNGLSKVKSLISQAQTILDSDIRARHEELAKLVPVDKFYRYHYHWKFVTQSLVFCVTFIEFLTTHQFLTREQVSKRLYLSCERKEGVELYFDLEDYLHGLLTLSNELPRLAVNSVTSAEYDLPLKISTFLNDLDSGFKLLNLKNDSLRKRFDSLKYDLKRVEEVVYDISIRGLGKGPPTDE